jgi:septum formation protein
VFAEKSTVYFRTLTEEQIDYYLQNFPPLDKAGAYAIQEYIGAVGIEKIIGDYYNVVGLPVGRLLHCLNTKFND